MDKIENLSSTPPGSSLLYIGNLRNPSCWSECEYFYRHGQFHFLEIQWEISFLTFLNTEQNAPKKKFRIVMWTFSFEICFQNQFSISGSGQTKNTQIRVFGGKGSLNQSSMNELMKRLFIEQPQLHRVC